MYLVPIDSSDSKKPEEFIAKFQGFVNVRIDDATINLKKKVSKIHEHQFPIRPTI